MFRNGAPLTKKTMVQALEQQRQKQNLDKTARLTQETAPLWLQNKTKHTKM